MENKKPQTYWEQAGKVSYAEKMYVSPEVGQSINQRLWKVGFDIGKELGLNEQSHVLDLGCGDGILSNTFLSKHYRAIDGFDLSPTSIQRAQSTAPRSEIHFNVQDITKMDYSLLPQYDGAYLWGILHHVKTATPNILKNLRKVAKRLIILEPNGNHILRKLFEHTAAYKAMGEESFRTRELEKLFNDAGYKVIVWKRLNFFPNFTPNFLYKLLRHLEPVIEKNVILQTLCTANMWGLIADDNTNII